jgi:hypothetical protein
MVSGGPIRRRLIDPRRNVWGGGLFGWVGGLARATNLAGDGNFVGWSGPTGPGWSPFARWKWFDLLFSFSLMICFSTETRWLNIYFFQWQIGWLRFVWWINLFHAADMATDSFDLILRAHREHVRFEGFKLCPLVLLHCWRKKAT